MESNVRKNEKNVAQEKDKLIADVLFDARKEFIVLGLCGRTGSGVSTISDILTTSFEDLNLPAPSEAGTGKSEDSEYRILYRFGKENFERFIKLKTSSLITATVLEYENKESKENKENKENDFQSYLTDKFKLNKEKAKEIADTFLEATLEWKNGQLSHENLITAFKNALQDQENVTVENEIKVSDKDNASVNISFRLLQQLFKEYLDRRKTKGTYQDQDKNLLVSILYTYIFKALPKKSKELWEKVDKIEEAFLSTIILQKMGNNVRTTKSPYESYQNKEGIEKLDSTAFQEIAHRINIAIKILRDYVATTDPKGKTIVVIDSIKNPFESMYLKDRYSSYYLVAVYTENQERRERLEQHKKLDRETIKLIDTIEQFSELKRALKKIRKEKELKEEAESGEGQPNQTKMEELLEDLCEIPEYILQFIVQNVEACIQSADIFINNPPSNNQYIELKKTLLRYVSLMMYPGLVLPTNIERCMQIAFAAKSNSGCISRQVGAVITDSKYHLCSIGWNQVPEGQMPCTYRNLVELHRHWNTEAYSCLENNDDERIQQLIAKGVQEFYEKEECRLNKVGRETAFCFKDLCKDREQVYVRSLHAEETAFLNLTGDNKRMAEGGYLFTTSSPCVSCAKKAAYMGISKIYYIEPYPGITFSHILAAGPEEKRIESVLFTGAIGRAYTQLYTPLFPKKDELELWLGHKLDYADIKGEKWKDTKLESSNKDGI